MDTNLTCTLTLDWLILVPTHTRIHHILGLSKLPADLHLGLARKNRHQLYTLLHILATITSIRARQSS